MAVGPGAWAAVLRKIARLLHRLLGRSESLRQWAPIHRQEAELQQIFYNRTAARSAPTLGRQRECRSRLIAAASESVGEARKPARCYNTHPSPLPSSTLLPDHHPTDRSSRRHRKVAASTTRPRPPPATVRIPVGSEPLVHCHLPRRRRSAAAVSPLTHKWPSADTIESTVAPCAAAAAAAAASFATPPERSSPGSGRGGGGG